MSKTSTRSVVLSLTKAFTKRFFRNHVALFFTIVFPLIFLFVFGGIFGNDSAPRFSTAIINKSNTEFSAQFISSINETDIFEDSKITDFSEAKEKVGRGELDAIIEVPEDFGQIDASGIPKGELVVYFDEGDQQLAGALVGALNGIIGNVNSQFVKISPPITLKTQKIQTANLTTFDYMLSGMLGFSILGLGIFSMANGFTVDKKTGALRRLKIAPIKSWQIIIATAINRIIVGIVTVAIMFAVALVVFDFNMRGDYLSFILFSIFSMICMFGFGMAIAGWAKDDNQAAPLSNLIAFPMMFLSGTFFPRFLMPEFLQKITDYLPLTPIVDGFRMILTEGKNLVEIGPQLMLMTAWTIVIYLVAFKVFRWE